MIKILRFILISLTLLLVACGEGFKPAYELTLGSTSAPIVQISSPDSMFETQSEVTLTGLCTNGIKVEISGDIANPQSVNCVNGQFSSVLTLLGNDGTLNITVKQTSPRGLSSVDIRTFVKDTVAPTVTVLNVVDNAWVGANVQINGTCETGLPVVFAVGGLNLTANCTNNAFSTILNLANVADGTFNLEVSQTDKVGLKGTVARVIRKDVVPPQVLITAPAANSVFNPPLNITGSCETGRPVVITATGLAAPLSVNCTASAFNASLNLGTAEGAKTVTVTQTDEAGNTGSSNRSFVQENPVIPPLPVLISAPAANSVHRTGLTLQGSCVSGVNVTISGNVAANVSTACNNSAFSAAVNFSAGDGVKTITVRQQDATGNSGMDSRSFVRDSTAPNVTIAMPAANTPSMNGVTISGACEAGLTVVVGGSGAVATSSACGAGSYSANVTFSASDGSKTITVTQTDAAGNVGTASRNFVRDTVIPQVTITSPPAGTSDPTGLTITGTCETGLPVRAEGSGVKAVVTQACTAAAYSLAIVFSDTDGTKLVNIVQTDLAGNVGKASRSFNRVTPAPVLDGVALYGQNCASCHNQLANSTKLGRTAAQITSAIQTQPTMANLNFLSSAQVQAIADALKGSGPVDPAQPRFQCTDPNVRGLADTGLRRLSSDEYKNTLEDIFGADVVATVGALTAYPADTSRDSVGGFNPAHARDHVEAIFNISLELAQKVIANNTYLNRVAPACVRQGITANAIADNCITQFAREFGLKIHRRSLSSAQEQSYLAVFKDPTIASLTIRQRVETVMARILQAPEAVYHWTEVPTPATAGNRARVDAFTVASRLSYRLIGSTPDTTLLAAAANGTLTTVAQVQTQAERLLNSPRGRQKVRSMVHHWLRLHKAAVPTVNAAKNAGISSTDVARVNLKNELVNEVLDFAEHIIFTANGTFSDLMNSNLAFPKSADAAKIFGTGIATNGPVQANNGRQGLIMRPAILLSSTDRDAPIKRGVSLRLRVLCDDVPPPPADIDSEINDIANSFDHSNYSSRQVAEMMTGGGTCVNCHSRLNSLGFALSSFGPLGELRTVDRSFNANGTVKNEFPVNSMATNLDVISANDSVSNHIELASLMAQAQKPKACLAIYAFRASRNRLETAADICQLADTEAAISGNNMTIKQGLIKNVSGEDIFWKGF